VDTVFSDTLKSFLVISPSRVWRPLAVFFSWSHPKKNTWGCSEQWKANLGLTPTKLEYEFCRGHIGQFLHTFLEVLVGFHHQFWWPSGPIPGHGNRAPPASDQDSGSGIGRPLDACQKSHGPNFVRAKDFWHSTSGCAFWLLDLFIYPLFYGKNVFFCWEIMQCLFLWL